MKKLAGTLPILLLAVAATAIAQDPAPACNAKRTAAEAPSPGAKTVATETAKDLRLRRPTLRAF